KTASASATFMSYTPAKAIDNSVASEDIWIADNVPGGTNQWWAVDLGTATTVATLRLIGRSTGGYLAKNFRLEHSADGATWTVALTAQMTNNTAWQEWTIAPTSARHWRLYILDTWGYIGLGEVELLLGTGGAVAFTATSAAFAADTVPITARLVLRHQPIGTVVLGTDLIVEASRDNGATWTAGPPVRQATIAGVDVLTADIPLSGQPSGLSMRWRVRTTAVEQRLHAISMQW
ncbi:MAG: discoidin domain-containing protein, partial [Alphaproteobacteria bacterium]|nr:discoidin domain-containing protein [Alphaproteobacteria bacterium]